MLFRSFLSYIYHHNFSTSNPIFVQFFTLGGNIFWKKITTSKIILFLDQHKQFFTNLRFCFWLYLWKIQTKLCNLNTARMTLFRYFPKQQSWHSMLFDSGEYFTKHFRFVRLGCVSQAIAQKWMWMALFLFYNYCWLILHSRELWILKQEPYSGEFLTYNRNFVIQWERNEWK